MKELQCKDCGITESVPDEMPEPWICDNCQAQHKKNEAEDFDFEQEMANEEAWNDERTRAESE